MTYQGFYSNRSVSNSKHFRNNHSLQKIFFLSLTLQITALHPHSSAKEKNMLSVLQMSKLNHMADKFDLFLKDMDLNDNNKKNTYLK